MGILFRWIVFNIFVLVAVALDLGVFHRRPHKIQIREAAVWSGAWLLLSLLFGGGVYWFLGRQPELEYFTGYLIEKSLSIDNLFLFLVIFRAFAVDERVQHRLLAWGVVGALLMRGIMIALGAALIERFEWILYAFGGFLIYAGIHMLFSGPEKSRPEESKIFKFASTHLRVTHQYHGERFFVRLDRKLFATPLFLVLLVVEITDITLAVDSIPAIFGITHNAFIVYTSNVFAILGLRALYFLLAGALGRLRYLTVGLSFVLIFIGGKMFADHWWDIPVHVSLGVVAVILGIALVASLLAPPKSEAKAAAPPADADPAKRIPNGGVPAWIKELASADHDKRRQAAAEIYAHGKKPAEQAVANWWSDAELSQLLRAPNPVVTVGIAVKRETFDRIRRANLFPDLASVPPDQDAQEFELRFGDGVELDVLTSKEPKGQGAIARYLGKFGEGIQQVELRCLNVDRATAILRDRFQLSPIYPEARPGANGTKVNFFLTPVPDGGADATKVLIELYEPAARSTTTPTG